MVRLIPVMNFPPLRLGPLNSCPAFSAPPPPTHLLHHKGYKFVALAEKTIFVQGRIMVLLGPEA